MLGAGRTLSMRGSMFGLLKDTGFLVVVGYAGGEDGVMELLFEASEEFQNLVIYWIFYENDYTDIRPEVRELLSGTNKYYILGQDADVFFAALTRALKFHPSWMEKPLLPLEIRHASVVYKRPNPELDLAMKDIDELLTPSRIAITTRATYKQL